MQLSTRNPSRGLPYKWMVVIVVTFGAFMSTLDQTVVNNALPSLQHAFVADLHTIQWIATAYTLTQGVVTPTTAFFASYLSTKRFYLIALAFFTLGSALCGLAWNLPALILFRVVQAVGGATLFPLALTLLFAAFPVHQRGLAMGLLGISSLMAPAIGPTLGGYLVTYANWSLIFFINVPIGIVGMMLGFLILRSGPSDRRAHLDLPGFALAATGLAAVLYALSNASTSGWSSPAVLATLSGGLCLLVMFVVVELRIARHGKQPLVELRLFANGPFLRSNIASALISFSFFGSMILFPVYLQELRGLSAFQSGLLTLPQAFASVLASIVGGRIIDRFGPRVVLFPGLVLVGLSTWQLAEATLTTSYSWLLLIFAVRGLGLGSMIQPLIVSALSQVQPREYTQASSLNTVVRLVSTSLGIAILAPFVQRRASERFSVLVRHVRPQLPTAVAVFRQQSLSSAVRDAFWVSFATLVLALVAVCLIRSQKAAAS